MAQYLFRIDNMHISEIRSADEDTDVATVLVKVGNRDLISNGRKLGEVDKGDHAIGVEVGPINIGPNDRAAFSFTILNNGHDTGAASGVQMVIGKIADYGGKALDKVFGGLPVGTVVAGLVKELADAFTQGCDGVVAADALSLSHANLAAWLSHANPHTETRSYPGYDSPWYCGDNSLYNVTWSIEQVTPRPSIVADSTGYVGVFVVDVNGRVHERPYRNGWQNFQDHGPPPSGGAALCAPSMVVYAPTGYTGGFLTADNGHVIEICVSSFGWNDHDPPAGTTAAVGSPSLIVGPSEYLGAMVRGVDGHLYELCFSSGGTDPWVWVDHRTPANVSIVSDPSLVAAPSGYIGALALGSDAHIHELRFIGGVGWQWFDCGVSPGNIPMGTPSLVAGPPPGNYIGAMTRTYSGRIFELGFNGERWGWLDHGSPPGTNAVGSPALVAAPSGYVGCFVRGANGNIYELYFDRGNWLWTDHGSPGGTTAAVSDPAAIAPPTGYVGVFVMGANNHLYELYFDQGWAWTDHGSPLA